jgi:JAB1/Mov34/MPN/PAD-1 ubiquitin protease
MTMYLHIHRFWKKNDTNSEFAYGILMGTMDERIRTITEAIPILHSKDPDLVFGDEFFKHWDDLNKLKQDLESNEMCIGWYKIMDHFGKFKAKDIRNQVKIQTLGMRNIAILIEPDKFLDEDEYGFSVFRLKSSANMFHEMCDYKKIEWEIMELGSDVDRTVNMVLDLITKYSTDTPYVEEIDEFQMPEIIDDGNDDDGEYVTPDIDPNAPIFY